VNTTSPSVTGTAQEGQILRADQGSWRGLERKTGKFAFQWRLCGSAGLSCADVAKANDRIYVLRPSDVGQTLAVELRGKPAGAEVVALPFVPHRSRPRAKI